MTRSLENLDKSGTLVKEFSYASNTTVGLMFVFESSPNNLTTEESFNFGFLHLMSRPDLSIHSSLQVHPLRRARDGQVTLAFADRTTCDEMQIQKLNT